MTSKGHALSRDALIRTLTAYSGITTADGADDGTTLIDSNLIDNASISPSGIPEKTILILNGNARGEDKGAASFNNGTGAITLQGTGFSAQIKAGTIYKILNISSVETLIAGLISFSGTTTAEGGGGGSSLICSDLAAEADFDGNQVVITSGDYRGQARDITADTTGGTVTPHLNFGGVIVEGTEFIITAMRTVPAEVAALETKLGEMVDAATNDNMTDITTTSVFAKLRLILNRMSPDAFAPRIYGDDRTTLELALNNLAKYWAGNANQFGVKINNGLLRTNLNDLLDDWATVFGMQGASQFLPRVYGQEATTIEEAFLLLARYWTPNGNIIGTRINNFPERSNLIALLEDWANVFGMQGANQFLPRVYGQEATTIEEAFLLGARYWTPNGNVISTRINNFPLRSDLITLLEDWATVFGMQGASQFLPRVYGQEATTIEEAFLLGARYWSANGNQFNSKINNGVARTNLNDLLDDWALLFGVAGASVFEPTIGGVARTTIEAAWAAMATYFATAGAAIASTVDPGGTERATLELILEDLGKILAGGGLTTYPAAASPSNAVNMAQVLRAIVNSLTGSDTYTAYTKFNNVACTSLDGVLQALAGLFAADGTNVFEPTIQGSTRANMETALFAIASYFVSAAGAYSIKVNNNDLRTNLEQILQDFFAVIGCDGTNVFDPSIGGSDRLTFDAAFEALDSIIGTIDTEVADIEAKLDTQKGATGVFYEQADAAVNISAIAASETNVLDLSTASTRYIVRSLRLKCADPGGETVTVRLYEFVNDGLTEVDSFAIDTNNFGTFHSLMDMFGLSHLAGDSLKVTVKVSAGVAVAVTGQYSHAKNNV